MGRGKALRRNELDRSKVYAIAHNGRAWETVGVVGDLETWRGSPEGTADRARPEGPRVAGPRGRHVAGGEGSDWLTGDPQ